MPRRAAHGWLIGLAIAMMLGCTTRRAPQWFSQMPTPPRDAAVTLVVLGNTHGGRRGAQQVATRLETVLRAEKAAHRRPLVLWLGNASVRPQRACSEAARKDEANRGIRALEQVVAQHVAQGGKSFAVRGPREWHCAPTPETQVTAHDDLYRIPAPHYVVAIAEDGRQTVSLRCGPRGCEVLPSPADPLLELVFVDLWPWLDSARNPEASRSGLDALLAHLQEHETGHPRVLVSHAPIEAAGTHGVGGWTPDSTFHMLPPSLQEALEAGMFIGSIGGRDGASYAHPDVADAVLRADKRWLRRGVFEVVSGAVAHADARRGRWLRYGTSLALLPDVYTPWTSFAVVHLGPQGSQAVIHGYHAGRWQHARITIPWDPPLRGRERRVPPMAPCLRCAPVPASFRE